MEKLKIILQVDESDNEETKIKVITGKLLRSILVIFMLSWIVLLSSCFFRPPGHGGHRGGGHERHEEHGHNDHH